MCEKSKKFPKTRIENLVISFGMSGKVIAACKILYY